MKKILLAAVAVLSAVAVQAQNDWANHGRYADANATLTVAPEVVFMGNSITDGWDDHHNEFFTDNNFACRGISGQVTGQMLCRFYSDVINLKPKAVVILAGTNDIAGNQGHMDIPHIAENIFSMAELAKMAGIRPLIASVLPCDTIPWNANVVGTAAKVAALNDMLREYAEANGITYVDYYTPLATPEGALDPKYCNDHVHPTRAGYDIMEPIVLAALASEAKCTKHDAQCKKRKDCKKKCDKKCDAPSGKKCKK